MSIEELIISFSYFAILILMSLNGVISFPSSQLLYILAGYFAFQGDLNPIYVILIGALGHSIGNYFLYETSRRKGLKYSIKFVKYLFPFSDAEKEVKKFQIAFKKRSIFFLSIGKMVNPIKLFISIPAGVTKMNRAVFLVIVYITSGIWASIFVGFGYYFGKSYENFGFIGAGLLIVALIVMSYFYKLMNSEDVLKELAEKK